MQEIGDLTSNCFFFFWNDNQRFDIRIREVFLLIWYKSFLVFFFFVWSALSLWITDFFYWGFLRCKGSKGNNFNTILCFCCSVNNVGSLLKDRQRYRLICSSIPIRDRIRAIIVGKGFIKNRIWKSTLTFIPVSLILKATFCGK